MHENQEYGQSLAPVNAVQRHASQRQRARQTHCVNILIGAQRVRVSGNFETIMSWVRLALAEMGVA